MDNPELQILFHIDNLIKAGKKPAWLKGTSCDNDNDSGSIVFDLMDGTSFILSTADIRQLDEDDLAEDD